MRLPSICIFISGSIYARAKKNVCADDAFRRRPLVQTCWQIDPTDCQVLPLLQRGLLGLLSFSISDFTKKED